MNDLHLLLIKARESRAITCVGTVRVVTISQNLVCVVSSLRLFVFERARAFLDAYHIFYYLARRQINACGAKNLARSFFGAKIT